MVAFEKAVGTRREVWDRIAKATGYSKDSLERKDLIEKDGQIISKHKSKNVPPQLKEWSKALKKAKKELGIKKGEMALVKGELLKKTKGFYSA